MSNKLLIILILIGSSSFAQNSVQLKPTNKNSILAKNSSLKSRTLRKTKHPYDFYFDQKIKEYEKRMEANVKKYKKMARKMKKPQYSDPSYFGHKRKPKKRGPGKRKFCKECEIVH